MTSDQLDEVLAIWSAADQFDRPFDAVTQAHLWEAAASQVPLLVTEVRRMKLEAKSAYLSGYLQGASSMRESLKKLMATHYDSGASSTIAQAPIPPPPEE